MKVSTAILWGIIGIVILSALGIGVAAGYRAYRRSEIAGQRAINTPNGIDTMMTVTLGGVEQKIQIRGRDRDNPVVLFLHGGPGSPWTAVAWRYQDRWEGDFTAVQWDQRGSGLNYYAGHLSETLSVEQYYTDTEQLVEFLNEWAGRPIVVMGHSWGSILGVKIALEHPDWLSAYVGVGQFVSWDENEQITYDWTLREAQERGDEDAVDKLRNIGRPPYQGRIIEKILEQRKIAMRYGAFLHDSDGMGQLVTAVLLSPDYSLDVAQTYDGGSRDAVHAVIPELFGFDLRDLGTRFDVPVYLFQGRHDWSNASELVADYYARIEAPDKRLVWFERSAHVPMLEEPDAFAEALREAVKAGVGE